MIKKLLSIRSVGKFRDFKAQEDIEFRRLSLVYGENGRGKTTLGAILRSLGTDDPNPVTERATLGSQDPLMIKVLADTGISTFKNGTWDTPYKKIAVYDDYFISRNVYSGNYIGHDHRKNLAQIVFGEVGVTLAKRIDSLDDKSREIQTEITLKKKECELHIPHHMSLDTFLNLKPDGDIERKISDAQSKLAAISDARNIAERPILNEVSLPRIPIELEKILAKCVESISQDVALLVKLHIQQHAMGDTGETWISNGLKFPDKGACPFCGQDIISSTLIPSFRAYFSDSFKLLQRDVAAVVDDTRHSLSDGEVMKVRETLTRNEVYTEFWKHYVDLDSIPHLNFDQSVLPVLNILRERIEPYLIHKSNFVLEPITLGEEVKEAEGDFALLLSEIAKYNDAIRLVNQEIAEKKRVSAAGNVDDVTREVERLIAQRSRHTPEVASVCAAYTILTHSKAEVVNDKTAAKNQLEAYSASAIDTYQSSINRLLKRFNAGFRISSSRLAFTGGAATSSYKFSIGKFDFDPGNEKTPLGTACFRSTLSSGDRSTLALAFFLAQLNSRADLAELTVVFDDPFTSLDAFRQHATRDQIRKIYESSKQVVVFSHNCGFLDLLRQEHDSAQLRLLQVIRYGVSDSTISPWDIDATLTTGIDRDIATMAAFEVGEVKDQRAVIRCIRPVLENFIRRRHPEHFGPSTWLGTMLENIRDADQLHPLANSRSDYDDLTFLNTYTKKYHHDDNTAKSDYGVIQDAELLSAVAQTLQLIGCRGND